MKKFSIALLACTSIAIYSSWNSNVHSNAGGPPATYTGSPSDNKTCGTNGGCHGGGATAQTGWITSNVPVGGYVPGAVYTITATASKTGVVKFGFQVSPQQTNGTIVGSIATISGQGTQIVSTKYITHATGGTAGTNTKSWTFTWTAPAAGSGTANFYGAFNATNNDASSGGDQIFTSTLAIPEDLTAGISIDKDIQDDGMVVYPNPVMEKLTIRTELKNNSFVAIKLYDNRGKELETLLAENKAPGFIEETYQLKEKYASGTYFISIEMDNKKVLKKIFLIQ